MVDQNDYFGEMSLLDGSFRSATITSVENSKALLILRDDFLKLIRKYPDIALKMLIIFSRRLRKADEKIGSLTFFGSYGKIAKVLLELIDSKG